MTQGRFADVTAATKLPASLLRAPAYGVWAADIDTDGDLDLVLAPRDGAAVVLRNNADGTFTPEDAFPGVTRVRGFAWADFDGEGVPDAALLDEAGAVHVFLNQRGGSFRAEPLPGAPSQAVAIAPAAMGGAFDLLVLSRDGQVARLSRKAGAGSWETNALARVDPPSDLAAGPARLLVADLDNNGAPDLIVASATATKVVLGGPGGAWTPLAAPVALGVQAVADLEGDGRLDLIGRLPDGRPGRARVKGSKPYHWQILRTRATTVTGRSADQLVRHWRRDRDSIRAARAEAGDRRSHRPLRAGRGHERRGRPHHLAERRPAVGVRREGRHDGEGHAAAQGIVPVAVRVGWR